MYQAVPSGQSGLGSGVRYAASALRLAAIHAFTTGAKFAGLYASSSDENCPSPAYFSTVRLYAWYTSPSPGSTKRFSIWQIHQPRSSSQTHQSCGNSFISEFGHCAIVSEIHAWIASRPSNVP